VVIADIRRPGGCPRPSATLLSAPAGAHRLGDARHWTWRAARQTQRGPV